MDFYVKEAYERLLKRDYRQQRSNQKVDASDLIDNKNIPLCLRVSERLSRMVEAERPQVYQYDRIGFYRYIKEVPSILSEKEFKDIAKDNLMFDGGIVCNISSDYAINLNNGFDERIKQIDNELQKDIAKEEKDELLAMKNSILAIYKLCEKYRQEALLVGNDTLADILTRVPYKKPENYHEALVFLRIMNFGLWLNGNKHNTLGRFDQYMYPFFKKDFDSGLLSEEEAKNLTEEFFVSINFDADLYPGVQQGDNGQSLVLGGVKKDGTDAYNELSKICLEASLELKLIDPKINLRVNKNTDMKWFRLGTELTKQGLGFPQYSNDDVVIPSLVKLGYDLEDARDYVVAACWEFIIPGVAMDIPNIDALSFPKVVDMSIRDERFNKVQSIDEFYQIVDENIAKEVKRMVDLSHRYFLIPSPFQSVLMTNCVENRKDIAVKAKYNNIGFHGAGLSTAADSLAAIQKMIFENQKIDQETLLNALDSDFVGYEKLRNELLECPKMGNNEDYVDNIACHLLEKFGDECSKYHNDRGGIYRAGTGTAMYYIWFSQNMGATPDGRKAGEPFSANYSPSLSHNFKGVLSVIKSFTKPHLEKACNGGPLTLEFHDTLFRNEEGSEKVAELVKTFIILGGHQLQLNAINRETLLDAQKHPEKYPNLIVRVWGWSGYFNELDLVYQNHIIKRLEFLN